MLTESERVDRFEAAFNRIDHGLTDILRNTRARGRQGFASKVRTLANEQRRFGRYADFLLEIGELRNSIVHNRTAEDVYIAVPNEETVLKLEMIEQRIMDPERVIPRFQGKVVTISPEASLAESWELVYRTGYSRFPVYDREGFLGILTSNGMTRWCAKEMNQGRSKIDAASVEVSEVLQEDHRRDRAAFIARSSLIEEVDDLFSRKEPLEAVIITEHGKVHERPLGIICAADMAAMAD